MHSGGSDSFGSNNVTISSGNSQYKRRALLNDTHAVGKIDSSDHNMDHCVQSGESGDVSNINSSNANKLANIIPNS